MMLAKERAGMALQPHERDDNFPRKLTWDTLVPFRVAFFCLDGLWGQDSDHRQTEQLGHVFGGRVRFVQGRESGTCPYLLPVA